MRLPAATFLTLAALLTAGGDAFAWSGPMDSRVIREAVRLMPLSLRGILENHVADLTAGAREASGEENDPLHRLDPAQTGASAAQRLEEMAVVAVRMIDNHRPFADVSHQLGAMAHVIGDLNNPLQVSSADPREGRYAVDYAEYVESNLDRFPLVFYGWKEPSLDEAPAGVRQFASRIAGRSRPYYRHISRAYAQDNPTPVASRFDVRSLPFGIGSLSYSHSVTDTAKVWLYVWKRAHGDLKGTPYLARETMAPAPVQTAGPGANQ